MGAAADSTGATVNLTGVVMGTVMDLAGGVTGQDADLTGDVTDLETEGDRLGRRGDIRLVFHWREHRVVCKWCVVRGGRRVVYPVSASPLVNPVSASVALAEKLWKTISRR